MVAVHPHWVLDPHVFKKNSLVGRCKACERVKTDCQGVDDRGALDSTRGGNLGLRLALENTVVFGNMERKNICCNRCNWAINICGLF